jgi:hypothetical protein
VGRPLKIDSNPNINKTVTLPKLKKRKLEKKNWISLTIASEIINHLGTNLATQALKGNNLPTKT